MHHSYTEVIPCAVSHYFSRELANCLEHLGKPVLSNRSFLESRLINHTSIKDNCKGIAFIDFPLETSGSGFALLSKVVFVQLAEFC